MIDYHIHTARCHHACGTMAEYVVEAEKKELTEMGFADHFPLGLLGYDPKSPVSMAPGELADYIAEVRELQKKASMPVRLGVEVDFLPGREKETAAALAPYSFDYVIGSIHFIGDWDFTHPGQADRYKTANMDALYEQYFSVVQNLAASGICQIMGHLDVVKKFAFFPRKSWEHLVDETCRVLKKYDLCVELNSAGWRAPVGESYPGEAFLARCLEMGIPVTLGSDAHRPQDVGSGLVRALLMLYKLGFREVAAFSSGTRSMKRIAANV